MACRYKMHSAFKKQDMSTETQGIEKSLWTHLKIGKCCAFVWHAYWCASQLEAELLEKTYISQDKYNIWVDVTSTDSQHF
jgi:hypothetical protein